MKISFNNAILIAYAIISTGIFFLARETYLNNRKYQETFQWVEHTQEVLYESEQILSIIKDIETAVRGYVISNKEAFLQPFGTGKKVVSNHLSTLLNLTSDNLSQQKRIHRLSELTFRKISFSETIISTRREKGFEHAKDLVAAGMGMFYMDSIRNIVGEIQQEENRLMKLRKQVNDESNIAFNKSFLLQIVAIILAIMISSAFIFFNVKAKQKAQGHLFESQQLLQSIIDNTSSSIYVKDLEGKFILINKTYAEKLGQDQENVKEKTVFDFLPKQIAAEIRATELQVLNEKRVVESEDKVLLNGEVQYFISTRYPLYDTKGAIYALCGISTNITEIRKQANLIQDLYDNAPCGYYSIDADRKFLNANHTTLAWLGYTKEELTGKAIWEILTEECRADFENTFPVFKKTGKINNKVFTYIRKDGSLLPVLLNSSAEKDEDGNFLYSRSTIFDITERKKLEDELKQVNKELESFTYSISHDLRAPLRIMNGYAGIIAEEYADVLDEDGRRMVKNIIENAHRMGQLIDDLLNFSRLGRKEVVMHSTNMNAIVKQILEEQLNGEASRYIVKVDDLGKCISDSSLIKQVWQNLISNAIKYSGKNLRPVIEIKRLRKDDYNIYSIQDNGAGFDMKYYDKLFGVFQRLHKVSEFEGTGVGLALAQRIVAKHGGQIWAESKVNEGATFYFSLKG